MFYEQSVGYFLMVAYGIVILKLKIGLVHMCVLAAIT